MKVNNYLNQALKEHGLKNGSIQFDPPTAGAVFERYKELMKQDKYDLRTRLISRFTALYVGELPEIDIMPLDELEHMIDTLERAQAAGELNLETDQGVNNLQAIVDPYLERLDNEQI
jgi:hypothetical protein